MLALDDPYASQRVHSTHPLLLICYKRIAPVDIHGCSAGATAYFSDLIQSTCYMHFPVFRRFQEGNVIIGADDVLQRLLVLAVFVAGLVEKGLNDLTAVIFLAVCAGDVAFSQAAFLHPAFGPAQIPGAIQDTPACSPCSFFDIRGRSYSRHHSSRFPLYHSYG